MSMFVDANGEQTDATHKRGTGQRRPRKLTKHERRTLRDLMFIFLTDTLGVSHGDAHSILVDEVHEKYRPRRTKALRPLIDEHGVMPLLTLFAQGDSSHAQ